MSKQSSNQVTIRVDQRALYGVIAVVAVIATFAIGWFLATRLNQPAQPTVATSGQQPAPGAAPALGVTSGDTSLQVQPANQAAPGAPPQAQTGSSPVSPDEVPVGASEPRIWIDEVANTNYQFDLGQIPADKPTERDFTVKNVGNAELVIEDASASCGCTAALVEDKNLGPGETTVVRVSYDPRVNEEFGRFVQKQVRIKSNDPLVPLAEFTITADVAAQ